MLESKNGLEMEQTPRLESPEQPTSFQGSSLTMCMTIEEPIKNHIFGPETLETQYRKEHPS